MRQRLWATICLVFLSELFLLNHVIFHLLRMRFPWSCSLHAASSAGAEPYGNWFVCWWKAGRIETLQPRYQARQTYRKCSGLLALAFQVANCQTVIHLTHFAHTKI